MKTTIAYELLSPDGFPFLIDGYFKTAKAAQDGAKEIINERYAAQGFYSTSNREKLSLSEAADYCQIVKVELDEDDLKFYNIYENYDEYKRSISNQPTP